MENKKLESIIDLRHKKFTRKGIFHGLLSGLLFGLNGLFLGLIFNKYSIPELIMFSLVCAGINDLFAGIILTIFNGSQGRLRDLGRSFLTFPGVVVVIGALIGGPIAQSGYVLGITYAGVSYTVVISALYSAIGAILSRIFLKQKIDIHVGLGILFCVVGGIIISYSKPTGVEINHFYIGILCSLVAAFGWATEGVIGAFGTSLIDPKIAINIREIVSSLIFLVIVIPIVKGYGLFSGLVFTPNAFMLFAIAGFFGAFSFLLWYKANNEIGVAKGMALNSTYVGWGILLSVLFLNEPITYKFIIGGIVIIIGVLFVSLNPLELLRRSKDESQF